MSLSKRQAFKIATPIFISLLAHNIIGITDTAFMARLGEVELGGAAMAGMVYFCIFTLGFGLGMGTQIIIARRHGGGQDEAIGTVMAQSILMLAVAAVFTVVLSLLFGASLYRILLSSEQVANVAIEYWEYRVWGYLFAFICTVFRSFFVGITRTKVLTYNAIVMALVNVILDYGLIFGHLGLPELGVKGAAIASVVAEISSLLFYIIYTIRKVDLKRYGLSLRTLTRMEPGLMRVTLNLSVYLMLQSLISMAVWTVFFIMIEKLGERSLAIATIIRSIYILLYIPVSAYGTVVNTSVSNFIGAGEERQIPQLLRMIRKISVLTMLTICTFMLVAPRLTLHIFTDDPQLITEAIPSLFVVCIALTVCSVGNMYFSAVSATGATKKALFIEMSTIAGYLVYSAILVYIFRAPVHICYTVEILYYIVIGWMSHRFVLSNKWKDPKWSRLN